MKSKIFMYLFILTALLVVFQYVNSKKIHEANSKKIESCQAEIVKYKDSLRTVGDRAFGLSEFTLGYSDEAVEFIEKHGFETNQLIALIEETLYEMNVQSGEHPLIPYPAISGGKMIVNSIRVLNHKWLITTINDGEYTGEMLLEYQIGEDGKISFKEMESLLYLDN